MTREHGGFVIETVSVTGDNVPNAEVTFSDGLNIIAGASNTGKSFVLIVIDFLFGAKKLERPIEEAKPYRHATMRVRERRSGKRFEVERKLQGGDATIRELASDGKVVSTRSAGARHTAGDETTLSHFWLTLSGFGSPDVRINAQGTTRSMSFRDVARLSVVDEARIISPDPPHQVGQYSDRTVQASVLRLLVTGLEDPAQKAVSKTKTVEGKGQISILQDLVTEVERELAALGLLDVDAEGELGRLDTSRAELFASLETVRSAAIEAEKERRQLLGDLRSSEGRSLVVDGLIERFELLDEHYRSDIERLLAIDQAAERLNELEPQPCAVCGAPASEHRADYVRSAPSPVSVVAAAILERYKIVALRSDLKGTLNQLREEARGLLEKVESVRAGATAVEQKIRSELEPRLRASSSDLRGVGDRRETLLRARMLADQRNDLRRRLEKLEPLAPRKPAPSEHASSRPSTADMDTFARHVEELLKAWNCPGVDRVVFSEDNQDLVMGGQLRAAQGKGVRAVTCAAFIVGLMRHCHKEGLPHPGVVALDSPLVAYKDPDPTAQELTSAGLADAFYRSLGDARAGQVIVFENIDPPTDLVDRITWHHFTKSSAGRHGFFPRESDHAIED